MNEVVQFITNGQTEFTPDVVVGLIVFCMIFDSLFMCVGNLLKVGKRK